MLTSGEKLRVYLGIDPTGPDLHLGHAITLLKMRELQDLGHEVIIILGDFTAMIGDPSDKGATRKQLTREAVLANAKNYKEQASSILNFGRGGAKIMYNSKWLSKMKFKDVLELASKFSVQQMLERDMFQKRIEDEKPIYIHEFMYPLMQGYDSVAMDVDGEVGGNDQTFNMLAGRTLMKEMSKKEKFVLTTKLLVDPTGTKMGKTEGSMVKLADSPEEMFGKIMSWTDGMILPAFEIATRISMADVATMKREMDGGANPRDYKVQLAKEIITLFHSSAAADEAEEHFKTVFVEHEVPKDVPEHTISEAQNIVDLLVATKLASSKSDARRLIDGSGIKVDGHIIEGYDVEVFPTDKDVLIQKGKRHFVKIVAK